MGRDAVILALAAKRGIYIDRLYNLLPSQGTDLLADLAPEDRVRYELLEERVNAMFGEGPDTVQDPLTTADLTFLADFAEHAWQAAEEGQRDHALWAQTIRDFAALHCEDHFVVVRSGEETSDFDVVHGSSYVRHEGDGFVLEGYAPLGGPSWHPNVRPEYVVEAWSDSCELLSSGTFTPLHGLVVDGMHVKEARLHARAQLGVAELLSCMSNMVPRLPRTEEQIDKERQQVEQLKRSLEAGRYLPEGNLQVQGVGETLSRVEFDSARVEKTRELQDRVVERRREKWALVVGLLILLCMGVAYQIVTRVH